MGDAAARVQSDPGALWPDALAIGSAEHLTFDGVDLSDLATERGTPLWVDLPLDARAATSTACLGLRAPLGPLRDRLLDEGATTCSRSIQLLHERGARIDCERRARVPARAARAACRPRTIILNGNGKSDAALARGGATRRAPGQRRLARRGARDSMRSRRELGTVVRCAVRVQLTYQRLLEHDPSFESTLRIGEGKFGSTSAPGRRWRRSRPSSRRRNLELRRAARTTSASPATWATTPPSTR